MANWRKSFGVREIWQANAGLQPTGSHLPANVPARNNVIVSASGNGGVVRRQRRIGGDARRRIVAGDDSDQAIARRCSTRVVSHAPGRWW